MFRRHRRIRGFRRRRGHGDSRKRRKRKPRAVLPRRGRAAACAPRRANRRGFRDDGSRVRVPGRPGGAQPRARRGARLLETARVASRRARHRAGRVFRAAGLRFALLAQVQAGRGSLRGDARTESSVRASDEEKERLRRRERRERRRRPRREPLVRLGGHGDRGVRGARARPRAPRAVHVQGDVDARRRALRPAVPRLRGRPARRARRFEAARHERRRGSAEVRRRRAGTARDGRDRRRRRGHSFAVRRDPRRRDGDPGGWVRAARRGRARLRADSEKPAGRARVSSPVRGLGRATGFGV